MTSPLLTIGIPTFNRSHLLEPCLANLGPLIASFDGSVELLISDNCSSDRTPEVISEFASKFSGKFPLKVVTQATNLGAVPNIFQLVDHASSDFLISMGDDDALKQDGIERILKLLNPKKPAHLVEGCWPWRQIQSEFTLDPASLSKWGYEIGLAWGSVYHVPSCRQALSDLRLRTALGEGIWGQIGMALVGSRLTNLPARVLPFSWGQIELERPFRYDYRNLLWSLRDLIRAHRLASLSTRDDSAVRDFLTLRNFGFRSHVFGLLVESLTSQDTDIEKAYWNEIIQEVKCARVFSALLFLTVTKIFMR